MKKKFKIHVYPKNETTFCVDVKSLNYCANIDTTLCVNIESREVVEDFECNSFIDARKLIVDIAEEMEVTIKSNKINRFGMCG